MKAVIAAIHGILTGGTNPDWPEQLEAWLAHQDPEMRVITHHYEALPFPRLNWFKNRGLAEHVGNMVEMFCDDKPAPPPIWLIAHSNGAVIALMAAKQLIARGYTIGGLILTGAASEADVIKSGVLDWVNAGQLGAAIAYSSADDAVVAGDPSVASTWYWRMRDWVWGKLMWPYGYLGRTGWLRDEKPFSQQFGFIGARGAYHEIFTRWFVGGHSAYFAEGKRPLTFAQMYQDIVATHQDSAIRTPQSAL